MANGETTGGAKRRARMPAAASRIGRSADCRGRANPHTVEHARSRAGVSDAAQPCGGGGAMPDGCPAPRRASLSVNREVPPCSIRSSRFSSAPGSARCCAGS
ncbi:hypothetical protein GSH04_35450 [Burkholderia pseudomallei]|nr:hypothetical protein [Burkholderia pseudomallei]MBM5634834.1 hypothetical protein [Burkholderia pseudomallei]MBM5663403.1 hypothetical protein [Burkholderia pseudomallei]